jgi:hypothetical protein
MRVALNGRTETGHPLYPFVGGCMTAANFLNELRAIQSAYQWFLTKDGRIRATLSNDRTNRVFDPITAVAFSQTGQFFPEATWTKAAIALGLSPEDCADFVSAFNFNWHPSSRQGTIRHDVLEAVRVSAERPAEGRPSWSLFTTRKRSPGSTAV